MSRGGIGSASIVLVFAVLCMAIFTAISFVSALTEQSLIEAELRMVTAYHAADTLAEQVLAEILAAEETPESVLGVEIYSYWDWDIFAERVYFVTNISETKELFVEVAIGEDGYEILNWRMYNIGEWEADERLNVWPGYFDDDFLGSW